MGFSKNQLHKLVRRPDPHRIYTRNVGGRSLDYIEGWFAIAEANAIFGFAGWDRETIVNERLFERSRAGETQCAYAARVAIRVRAGGSLVTRVGTGFGYAGAKLAGEAHERALKMAETDATKRALATFGDRFGLCLYRRAWSGGARKAERPSEERRSTRPLFQLATGGGPPLADNLSAEGFCTGLRQLIEAARSSEELQRLRASNAEALACLRSDLPDLRSNSGDHYVDVLERLIARRAEALHPAHPQAQTQASPEGARASRIGSGAAVDKSQLPVGSERRVRSKAHLVFVASRPCLVCEALPSQAHHLTFAQRRGLALKVSDEFTVPLCVEHHNTLHRSPPEREWWRAQGLDPLSVARCLWAKTSGQICNVQDAGDTNIRLAGTPS